MSKVKAHQDKPFRPPDPQSTEYREDVRLALIRTNERIDAILRRMALIEQTLEDNGITPGPP